MHRVALDSAAKAFGAETKLNNDFDFFELLRHNGELAARRFLDAHFDDIGKRSSVDLSSELPAEQG